MNSLDKSLKTSEAQDSFIKSRNSLKNSIISGSLQINNLSFRYNNNDQVIIDNLNLRISSSESLALLGPSGCGKSTLLHLISGLIRSTSGEILLDDQEITKPTHKCNLMLQKATLYPWLSVFQNAAFGLKIKGFSKAEIEKVVNPILRMVNLQNVANRNIRHLSGGQQQRVALARSLSTSPSVLLLDEPFSALDTFTRQSLQTEIRYICKKNNITLIIVTHDFDEAIRMSDRIIIMSPFGGGKIVSEIDNSRTFTSPDLDTAISAQLKNVKELWNKQIDIEYEI